MLMLSAVFCCACQVAFRRDSAKDLYHYNIDPSSLTVIGKKRPTKGRHVVSSQMFVSSSDSNSG